MTTRRATERICAACGSKVYAFHCPYCKPGRYEEEIRRTEASTRFQRDFISVFGDRPGKWPPDAKEKDDGHS